MDVSAEGLIGKRKGIGGSINLKYSFYTILNLKHR
jgi:hypothetical protein